MEPHERGAAVGEHGGLAFMADGHSRHRPAVMPKRRDVPHEPSPYTLPTCSNRRCISTSIPFGRACRCGRPSPSRPTQPSSRRASLGSRVSKLMERRLWVSHACAEAREMR